MSPLQYAASMFDDELAIRVVREGVDVDIDETGRDDYTALHMACEGNMDELLEVLLERKVLSFAAFQSVTLLHAGCHGDGHC